jgi:hypothetical protein
MDDLEGYWVTPSGRSRFRLRASVRRTSADRLYWVAHADAALRAAVWAVLLIDLLAAVALMVTVVTLARWAA